MPFDPEIAAIRFGTGLSPKYPTPKSIDTVLSELAAPDGMAEKYPITQFKDLRLTALKLRKLNRLKKKNRGTEVGKEATADFAKFYGKMARNNISWFNASLARYVDAPHGFRERLVRFWADHFTVVGKDQTYRQLVTPFVEEAIRPHVSGRFSDMLIAASLHPLMLHYLDQNLSIGPNSYISRRKKGVGINENLAREILELHSLGVKGGYSQVDVREFAELLTGLRFTFGNGLEFLAERAEPGIEEVLGKSYSGPRASLKSIHQALNDFAMRPDTAAHIARKLVVHFVSDTPDPKLVEHVSKQYLASGSSLMESYRAMLFHPDAWEKDLRKAKQPFDFVATSIRALNVDTPELIALNPKMTRLSFLSPLTLMGQPWERPSGPDGWPETEMHWFTPQGLAARIQWSMMAPQTFAKAMGNGDVSPSALGSDALGERFTPTLKFAAGAAETKWEGIGLILASPEFQRR